VARRRPGRLTGLLVWGQSKGLRGHSARLGNVHFWLGIALALIVVIVAAWRFKRVAQPAHARTGARRGGLLALVPCSARVLGGRMTLHHGVGVQAGGQSRRVRAARPTRGRAGPWMAPSRRQAGLLDRRTGLRRLPGERPRVSAAQSSPAVSSSRRFAPSTLTGCFHPASVTDADFAAIKRVPRHARPTATLIGVP
jgi:hypothetical protein